MELRILPSNIANMIAAGEVVQRPSSVVKELMENAVDAGSSQVTVIITDSGRTLIQVIDNGCGMTPDDAVLCFERHATSKIATAEDLSEIMTFGFRGEALASIAAVSDVTLKTRREEDEVGCIVEFSDSKHISTDETACPKGSNFAVRNLFFNVPARRKFLKSENVEFKHIIEEFTRIALTRPEIGFSLTHNGKDVFVLRPAKSLKFRILDLMGSNVIGDIVDIHAETSVVGISGFIGKPETAKKTLGNQFFFVNGRYFKSPYMHKAVMKAYEDLIPEGVTPSYFIYLTIDPGAIDVNIHPTKTEIKFEEDSVVFQIIYACIKETIGKNAFGATIDFEAASDPQMPILGKNFDEYRPSAAPQSELDPSYNPFDLVGTQTAPEFPSFDDFSKGGTSSGSSISSAWDKHSAADYGGYSMPDYSKYAEKPQNYGVLFEDKTMPSTQALIVQGKYIITPAKSGVIVVNIRRAYERILYDRFIDALSSNKHVTQSTLFPVQIQVGAAARATFDDNAEVLSSLGFDISAFGSDTIVVNGVPEGCSAETGKVQTMIQDILLILSDETASLPELMKASMAEKMSIMASSGSAEITSSTQAQKLVDTLFASTNPELTNSGKRILTILSVDELDKKF